MLITLYSTEGCHLCEQAYSLLIDAGVQERVQVVDIAFDDALFSRYGVTIPPVLSIQHPPDSISELGWPFDSAELAAWLNNNGIN